MLSVAQLERKRVSDRDAQRVIRQRTKERIQNLENTISEIRQSQEAKKAVDVAVQQHNRRLEEENAHIRMRLKEAGLTVNTLRDCESRILRFQVHDLRNLRD